MSCGMGFIKYLLFIFNFVFALCGLAILVVGVVVHLKLTTLPDTVDTNIIFPSITLIIIGSIIFVIAFFGCCGAIRESHCMTITFASFLLVILIIQIAVAVYAFIVLRNSDTTHADVRDAYKNIFEKYWEDPAPREIVDMVQSTFQCCGVDSDMDYTNPPKFNGTIPWSCCGLPEGQQVCDPRTTNTYHKGCLQELKNLLINAGTILGGVAIGIAGVELIGIIFALCLANSIKNSERRGYRV